MKLDVVSCVLVLACVRVTWGHVMFVRTPHGQRSQRDVDEAAQQKPTVMRSLHIESTILYRYAKTTVASRLANSHDYAKEISFNAILPESAFITAFHIELDDQIYHAYVKEKEAAHREYSEAVGRGQTAAKVDLTARDANRFTVSVNVEARTKVTFNLTYEELLTRRFGVYSNIINIAPGQILSNLSVVVNIEESNNLTTLRVPSLRLSNANLLSKNSKTRADPQTVIERSAPNKATIRWSPSDYQQRQLNQDSLKGLLTVEYDVERRNNPSQILVSDGYFIHFYAPDDLEPLKKHVVFLLDTSGSMYGSNLRQLKGGMKMILSDLNEGDYFSIITFSTRTKIFYLPVEGRGCVNGSRVERVTIREHVIPVAHENIYKAQKFIQNLIAQENELKEGEHIKAALIKSIKLVQNVRKPNMTSRRLPKPMIIFLTDGEATYGETNLQTILEDVGQQNAHLKVPIYSLALGRDADKDFLKKLSLKNYAFLRVIYDASDSSFQLRDFYRQIASPLLSQVTFHYIPQQVESDSISNLHFNTLYNGCELVVVGKLANASNTVEGGLVAESATGKYNYAFPTPTTSVALPPRENDIAPSFMEKMWAYLNVKQMLDKHMVQGDNSTFKYLALAVALKYSFVTPLTSMLVVKPNETSLVDVEEAGMINEVFFDAEGIPIIPIQLRGGAVGEMQYPDFRRRTDSRFWMGKTNTYNGTHIIVTENAETTAYEIQSSLQRNPAFGSCTNDTVEGRYSSCERLPRCILPVFSVNINLYISKYFCEVDGFVGSCCPDWNYRGKKK